MLSAWPTSGPATPHQKTPIMRVIRTIQPCTCGSGLMTHEEWDARGIYLCSCCEACRKERLAGFRPEVSTDPNYDADEAIEPEYEDLADFLEREDL